MPGGRHGIAQFSEWTRKHLDFGYRVDSLFISFQKQNSIKILGTLFKGEIDYISKVAKTEKDAMELIKAGFDFVCDFEGHKLFRKRKY